MRQLRQLLCLIALIGLLGQDVLADTGQRDTQRSDRRVGLYGGPAWSSFGNLGGNPVDRTGLFAGISLIKNEAHLLAMQYELNFLSRGCGGEADIHSANYTGPALDNNPDVTLDYVQLAALVRLGGLTNPDNPRARLIPTIYFGLAQAWLVSEEWYEFEREKREDFRGWDSSLILGFGTDLKLKERLLLTLGLRFDIGLDDIAPGYRNRSMIVTVGIIH